MSKPQRDKRNDRDLLVEPNTAQPAAPTDASDPALAPVPADEPAPIPEPLPDFPGLKMPTELTGKSGFRSPRSQAHFKPHYPPVAGSLVDWAIKKGWPQWLCAAALVERPIGTTYKEAEAEDIIRTIAGLKLGR